MENSFCPTERVFRSLWRRPLSERVRRKRGERESFASRECWRTELKRKSKVADEAAQQRVSIIGSSSSASTSALPLSLSANRFLGSSRNMNDAMEEDGSRRRAREEVALLIAKAESLNACAPPDGFCIWSGGTPRRSSPASTFSEKNKNISHSDLGFPQARFTSKNEIIVGMSRSQH